MSDALVSVWQDEGFEHYSDEAPYHPSESYPEYSGVLSQAENRAYAAVRNCFALMGLDEEHFGTSEWNPLGRYISPGETVLLKPNFVLDRNLGEGSLWSVITHPSVIRAVIDYAYIALGGSGRIIVADSPQADCIFDIILKETGMDSIATYYRETLGFEIEIIDLRKLVFVYEDGILTEKSRIKNEGDPAGYAVVDLGIISKLEGLDKLENIYGADYDRKELLKHHSNGKHEYCISRSVLEADVVINMPKIKTHKKAGVTLSLKNLVGINGDKNFLPHFRIGDTVSGGDEYGTLDAGARLVKRGSRALIDTLLVNTNGLKAGIYKTIRKVYFIAKYKVLKIKPKRAEIDSGSWYGNDTLWRTVYDLNYILEHADKDGNLDSECRRKILCVLDGMVAGEGNGPLAPDDKVTGAVIIGDNPVLADMSALRFMGFDYSKLALYRFALDGNLYGVKDRMGRLKVSSNLLGFSLFEKDGREYCGFREPDNWDNRIRIDQGMM